MVHHIRIMLRSTLLLIALAAFATISHAQSIQPGLLYWCSFIEGGSNFDSESFSTLPRTTFLGANRPTGPVVSAPCHIPYDPSGIFALQFGFNLLYTYTNGSSYPTTSPPNSAIYATNPAACLVNNYNTGIPSWAIFIISSQVHHAVFHCY